MSGNNSYEWSLQMKKYLSVIQVVGFLLLFGLFFTEVTDVLIKKEHKNNTVADFYNEPKNTVDVVFLGTSHAYHSFSPMELWKEEGISSYNLATSSQPLQASYYLAKEAIRTQHPKVIVLEVHGVKYEADYYSKARLHVAMDGIPMNLTKIEMFRDYLSNTMGFSEMLEYIFPISLYHTRWEELKKRDFEPPEPYTKGFLLTADNEVLEEPEILDGKADLVDIHGTILTYIDKLIELCRSNEVELVFVQAPMGNDEEYEMVQRKVNALLDYGAIKGVDCINFQTMLEKVGIDFKTDFVNAGHMNIYGADKIMQYMAPYLKEHYLLSDHCEETGYGLWDENLVKYRKRKNKVCK